MVNYPITFFGESDSRPGIQQSWPVKASNFQQMCSIPPEFEGPGTAFSPEDYFLLSLQNCFIATFKVFAEYSGLQFENLNVKGKLKVDKDADNKPMMKSLHLVIDLMGVSDLKKANILVKKTLDNGFILRSVKTEITTEIQISEEKDL